MLNHNQDMLKILRCKCESHAKTNEDNKSHAVTRMSVSLNMKEYIKIVQSVESFQKCHQYYLLWNWKAAQLPSKVPLTQDWVYAKGS